MGKTIKEVADMIGVSKTAIRKYMDDDFKSAYTKRDGEKSPVIISDEGVSILREKCKGKTTANQEVETTANPEKDDLFSILKAEMATLNEQLKVKDQQIKELTEANKNLTETNKSLTESVQAAQALNAADKKLLLEATTRKSFWSRIFGRKKQPIHDNQPDIREVS